MDSDECYDYVEDCWVCSICSCEFNQRASLEQHLNSGVHEQHLYKCQGCSRTFRNLGALNQHVNMTECSSRAARQVRVLLADADRQQGLLQLTDRSGSSVSRPAAPEGVLHFDGGASPNPGCGGAGYVLVDDRGHEVVRRAIGIFPYDCVTNNQAEYIALIQGMKRAKSEGMKRLVVKGDSELVINQMTCLYGCNSSKLVPLNEYAKELEKSFISVSYTHIPRAQNTIADALANQGKTRDVDYEVILQLHTYPPLRQ